MIPPIRLQQISLIFLVIKSVCDEYKRQGKFEHCYAEVEILFIKYLLISKMRRMKSSDMKNKYALFSSLTAALKNYFPNYNRNSLFEKRTLLYQIGCFTFLIFP
jgi:hypothetical protein